MFLSSFFFYIYLSFFLFFPLRRLAMFIAKAGRCTYTMEVWVFSFLFFSSSSSSFFFFFLLIPPDRIRVNHFLCHNPH